MFINPYSDCTDEADAIVKEISSTLRAQEKAQWEFKMRQYEDNLADKRLAADRSHEASMALINNVLGPLASHRGPFVSVKRSIF